ncbi:hypothetical protein [Magnetospirillum sp. SS-4]|uniref:hypothetical protein n=1 Tax=Magnetospirillum sp. SS-4 TaxID=2681465 RepID=UPI00137F9996|nr:hypothetical protein [Magnetospirillum sp. SS-4]CAA7617707.1 hypothetical protein MTBSS4_20010 [Magnetospirillum sp. SS-4]
MMRKNTLGETGPGDMTRVTVCPAAPDHAYTILVLYDPAALIPTTTRDHLLCFKAFTHFNVIYADVTSGSRLYFDLDIFDGIIIHYSCCIYRNGHLDPAYLDAVGRFAGPKILFVQDEYDLTANTIGMVRRLGVDVFYTTITEDCFERVYPRAEIGDRVEFVHTLTGYVPLNVPPPAALRPLAERPVTIGYRARKLHYRYGDLGQDKFRIGERMRAECLARGIDADIEWDEDKRIYGNAWPAFIERCRVTLGSESASNVFDYDGSLRAALDAELARRPELSYPEARRLFLAEREGRHGRTSMISPRVFEAISLKTGLVMFEGTYSGVVRPDRHYIPLAKDFSNLDEVFARIDDLDGLGEMIERSYDEIILSGRFSHARLAEDVAARLRARMGPPRGVNLLGVIHLALPDLPPEDSPLERHRAMDASAKRLFRRVALDPQDPSGRRQPLTTVPVLPWEQAALRESELCQMALPVLVDAAALAGEVHIFGTGAGARLLCRHIRQATGASPAGFIDTDLTGELMGLPVRRPDAIGGEVRRDATVILSNRYILENARILAARGCSSIVNGQPLAQDLARRSAMAEPDGTPRSPEPGEE